MFAVIETHPVQYHAPVYRALQAQFGIPVTAIYGSDFSVAGYQDREFGTAFAWDTDLLSGYTPVFLSRVATGGTRDFAAVSAHGLGAVLRELAPQAVLIHGYNTRFNQVACYEAWKIGCPILFRGETTDHARSRSHFKARMRDGVLRQLYQRFTRLLYIGRRSWEHYQRLGCADEKLVFSPYCVDVSPFETDEAARERLRTPTRQSLGVADGQIALLFSGKFSYRKGPDLILQAVKHLPVAVRERIVVVFLGAGQLREELERLAQASPQVQVRFPGFQNQTQLSCYFHAADLFVLPSREGETWGLVVNEALHHGVPCVVSEAVGSAPDLIEAGRTGYTFTTDSFQSLAIALEKSLPFTGVEAIRQQCRHKVNSYLIEDAASGIAKAYRQVI